MDLIETGFRGAIGLISLAGVGVTKMVIDHRRDIAKLEADNENCKKAQENTHEALVRIDGKLDRLIDRWGSLPKD